MMTFEPENFEYFDEYKELEATEAFDNEEGYEEASEEEFLLAKYAITDDEIALLERNSFSDDEEEWARFIWSDFSTIIPLAWRQQLRYYKVYSGSDTAAYIGSEPTQ